MSSRPRLHAVPSLDLAALEAVRLVSAEYSIPTASLKPCIAFLLDGNIGGAGRHDAAFVIAIECRRLGFDERETERILRKWAAKIGYSARAATRGIVNAYAKTPDGRWRYHPPGVTKKPGGRYAEVLGAICSDVGCPHNCAPFSHVARGSHRQGFEHFDKLGWPVYLRKQRHAAATDFYRAICDLERERGFAPGAPLLTSYRQLAKLADRDHTHVGDSLRVLYTRGLLTTFERGSGSGPHARDRLPSRIKRAIPIPNPPATHTPATTTGRERRP